MVQRKCKSNTIKLAWIAEVQPLFKIFNGCRGLFCMRPDRIFVLMSAEPNLFEFCRVQPKIMK